ncbi:DUF502 domain-containing protein [Coraliomargarita akajimensis]|uniref:DUF502 domain-containing protein n=1 Tax=Coraliomargarita akajimensis (strain DSM 45221 / IAM 15411 / JCM 23193 / KCTC 12865 / 04OKA010-24) TaxID=583355 RepID=D5EJJ1_CORAD|nr:DUF502 domain-containing protein [Coraliomargarita akajimensis]ADE54590.1 protein of unknown function DUF502 [Coraliomargarita akajimensis DSM 45221]
MLRSLRNAFITGLVVILPLGVTIIVINFLLEKLGTPMSNLIFGSIEVPDNSPQDYLLKAVSVAIIFAIITFVGYGSRFVLGRMVLNAFERLLERVPFINTVYGTVKQIVTTFSKQEKAVFQEVVLLEYPRKKCYVIGFLTSEAQGETQAVTGDVIVNVFVPTTPNPTSGFLLMLPKEDLTRLEMSVADGMKVIISGGAVTPPHSTSEVTVSNPPEATAPK